MARITISKPEAARRQIDAAIRMLFDGGDPVAIHTLAAAGGQILRDLCDAKGTQFFTASKDLIRPGMEKKFWATINKAAGFFKHADRSPDEILDGLHEEANDYFLLIAVLCYADLGLQPTPEMLIFRAWMITLNPHLLTAEASKLVPMMAQMEWLRTASRAEQLHFGNEALAHGLAAGSW